MFPTKGRILCFKSAALLDGWVVISPFHRQFSPGSPLRPAVLCVVPTRELAQQVDCLLSHV